MTRWFKSPQVPDFLQSFLSRQSMPNQITTNNRSCPPLASPAVHINRPVHRQRGIYFIENAVHVRVRGNIQIFDGNPLKSQIQAKRFSQLKEGLFIRRKKLPVVIDLIFLHQLNDALYPGTNQGVDLLFCFFRIITPRISSCQKFSRDNPVRSRKR